LAQENARAEKEFAAPGHGSWTEPQEEDPWQGGVFHHPLGPKKQR